MPVHLGRWCVRLLIAALIGCVGPLAVASSADAHVTVQPDAAAPGSFAVVAFRVPNERDDSTTTRLRVILPEDTPIPSVRTRALAGWDVTTRTRTLDQPLDLHGTEVTDVVAEVTWTARGDGVGVGQFEDFELSLGPLPESGEVVFTAIQTYASGEEVSWSEVSVDDSVEPEHPAPVLTIEESLTATEPADADAQAAEPATQEAAVDGAAQDGSTLAVTLSIVALLAAVGALALGWRRGRG